jgi:nucleotide-binding universal stress UspA family protein
MEKVKKILAPTDFSELSCVGLRYALEMARNQGAEVIVHHVIAVGDDWFSRHAEFSPVRDLISEQQRSLDQFLREKFADFMNLVEIRQVVEIGVPHANIVERAEREGADMIVMSTHGRTGLGHMLLGSVTEKVVARAPCPVLAVPSTERKKIVPEAA